MIVTITVRVRRGADEAVEATGSVTAPTGDGLQEMAMEVYTSTFVAALRRLRGAPAPPRMPES